MDCCLSYINPRPSLLQSLSTPKRFSTRGRWIISRRLSSSSSSLTVVVASAAAGSSSIKCGFSGLNAPLELNTAAGKYLSGVFLNNDKDCFHVSVKRQLEQLAADRDQAVARMCSSLGSDEAYLHRRIAELKELECQTAVEDVMYMLIFSKFSEIRVHLVPRLSRCIYNGRLEICPSRDWGLESIHSFEVLEMIREHITTVLGWRVDSSVTDAWATTQIQRLHLCRLYAASLLYGYFLKSASLRYHLEQSLGRLHSDLGLRTGSHLPLSEILSLESKNIPSGRFSSVHSTSVGEAPCSQTKKQSRLKRYVMGFDPETLKMCAKPKSKEAINLIERHSRALFGDEKTGSLESGEIISTSFASLKRFILEAVAFGSFLWDAEECVSTVYKLEENLLE